MIIYLLINNITELSYIGQTCKTLRHRLSEHWHAAKSGSQAPVHKAMREWDDPMYWDAIVLQNCYDQVELNTCEKIWIERCCTREQCVGFNVNEGGTGATNMSYRDTGSLSFKNPNAARRREDMSEAEREKYRAWGRQGAMISKGRPNIGRPRQTINSNVR